MYMPNLQSKNMTYYLGNSEAWCVSVVVGIHYITTVWLCRKLQSGWERESKVLMEISSHMMFPHSIKYTNHNHMNFSPYGYSTPICVQPDLEQLCDRFRCIYAIIFLSAGMDSKVGPTDHSYHVTTSTRGHYKQWTQGPRDPHVSHLVQYRTVVTTYLLT